eukprot:12458946-Ditylum_brightwellii.AAC.1
MAAVLLTACFSSYFLNHSMPARKWFWRFVALKIACWYSAADCQFSASMFCCAFVVGLDVAVVDAAVVVG